MASLNGEDIHRVPFSVFSFRLCAFAVLRPRQSAIQPLQRVLFDEVRSELSRAFAAVALGGIGDRAPLPWSAKISANLNYRAAVETLTNQQSGILDIL